MKNRPINPLHRFYLRVKSPNKNGCMEWIGETNDEGYGKMKVYGVHTLVHRYSYSIHNGNLPKDFCVLHKCDNKLCVAPYHLFLGTRDDNNKDRAKKDRSFRLRGDLNGMAKLTTSEVKEIKKKLKKPYHGIGVALSKEYNVSTYTISLIKLNKHWKYVK